MASARRVSGTAIVDRFDWLAPAPPAAAGAAPLFPRAPRAQPVPLRELSLPSATAERVAAAEQKAYAAGLAEGRRAGEATAAAQLASMSEQLTAAVENIGRLRGGVLRQAERDLVRLAIAMSERIVRREIAIDPAKLLAMAGDATSRLGDRVAATLHLHPSDHAALAASGAIERMTGSIAVVADANVPPGGCLVRSAVGSVDAGGDAQIRAIARAHISDDEDDAPAQAHDDPSGV
jgi:flagellar biosynthesis/type III secretory pathway protein FliH